MFCPKQKKLRLSSFDEDEAEVFSLFVNSWGEKRLKRAEQSTGKFIKRSRMRNEA